MTPKPAVSIYNHDAIFMLVFLVTIMQYLQVTLLGDFRDIKNDKHQWLPALLSTLFHIVNTVENMIAEANGCISQSTYS